jgi:hypothetical protein
VGLFARKDTSAIFFGNHFNHRAMIASPRSGTKLEVRPGRSKLHGTSPTVTRCRRSCLRIAVTNRRITHTAVSQRS